MIVDGGTRVAPPFRGNPCPVTWKWNHGSAISLLRWARSDVRRRHPGRCATNRGPPRASGGASVLAAAALGTWPRRRCLDAAARPARVSRFSDADRWPPLMLDDQSFVCSAVEEGGKIGSPVA